MTWTFPSTDSTLVHKEIRVSPKIRVLPSETLFQTLDFENFATAVGSRIVNKTREWPSLLTTPTMVDASCQFTTRRSTVTAELHYFKLLRVCCTVCSHSCAAMDTNMTDIAHRAVRRRKLSFWFQLQERERVYLPSTITKIIHISCYNDRLPVEALAIVAGHL